MEHSETIYAAVQGWMLLFRCQKKVTVAGREVGLKRNVKFENDRKWYKCKHGIQLKRTVSSIGIGNEEFRNDASEEQMNVQIESLEGEVKELQKGLKQENDSLRDELYKAEMIVRALDE